MKTGTKILALLLIFCLTMSVVSVSAAVTINPYGDEFEVQGNFYIGSNTCFRATTTEGQELVNALVSSGLAMGKIKISATFELADGYTITVTEFSPRTISSYDFKTYRTTLFNADSQVQKDMNQAIEDGLLTDAGNVNSNLDAFIKLHNNKKANVTGITFTVKVLPTIATFEPFSLGDISITYSKSLSDRGLSDEVVAASNFCLIIAEADVSSVPVADVTSLDALKGMGISGAITLTEDHANTTGDDTEVAGYMSHTIVGSAIDSDDRLVIALNVPSINNDTNSFDGETYFFLDGGLAQWTSVTEDIDASKLYLTDSRYVAAGNDVVTAVLSGDNVVISSKKSQPVCVTVADANGIVSMQNYILDLASPLEIGISAGQTVRVWEGTYYKTRGTTMKPLCAPITK